jgi:prolipoprotein diacylglyceryltransferase
MPLASIPSPGHAAWRLGPSGALSVRAYALCVIAGIIVAVLVASRRYRRSGGSGVRPGVILDVAAWAIPFGLVGALAHAILLDSRHDFRHAYGLWHAATVGVAAIGVPGAVALGNWWAQQFYGPPSTWWWAVRISPEHRVPGYENYATFQPAFLYQSLWDVALGFALIWAAGRFALSGERTFMLCAAGYAAGGFWVESMRVGPLPHALGMRYGALGDIAVFVLAVAGMYLTRPGRKPPARGYPKRALVGDSSGDVMSV